MDTPVEDPALLEQSAVVLDKYCYAKGIQHEALRCMTSIFS